MKLIPQAGRPSLRVSFERTALDAEVTEALEGNELEVVLDHPAARVDLEDVADSESPNLSSIPRSDGIDWTLNNAFKDYQPGMKAEDWFKALKPLRLRYDYGEPGHEPTEALPHTMLPGDSLVTEDGTPIRWLWDTPLADQIREVEKAKGD